MAKTTFRNCCEEQTKGSRLSLQRYFCWSMNQVLMRFGSTIIHSSPECRSPAQLMQEVTENISFGIPVAYQVTPINCISLSRTEVSSPKTCSKQLSAFCLCVISTINPSYPSPLAWL